jgi:hypothetical protein
MCATPKAIPLSLEVEMISEDDLQEWIAKEDISNVQTRGGRLTRQRKIALKSDKEEKIPRA